MKTKMVIGVIIFLIFGQALFAGEYLNRYALLVGANYGGDGRVRLRYAENDARTMRQLLEKIGGVASANVRLLTQPDGDTLREELASFKKRIKQKARYNKRSEFIFYYSGHSDHKGLLLGEENFRYRDLKKLLHSIDSDIRIAMVDSCASGVLIRLKGGKRRAPFLSDSSMQMKGTVYMTSSSSDEAAQESDKIRGSFFTHYLVSGMRGAADTSQDGRVTLNEAYQYAFHQTLASTEKSAAGPQHPGYAIDMSGSGDVVLTDIRNASAKIILNKNLQGRVAVRNDLGLLTAEVSKVRGVPVMLGVEAGSYRVLLQRSRRYYQSRVNVRHGASRELGDDSFTLVGHDEFVRKGDPHVDQETKLADEQDNPEENRRKPDAKTDGFDKPGASEKKPDFQDKYKDDDEEGGLFRWFGDLRAYGGAGFGPIQLETGLGKYEYLAWSGEGLAYISERMAIGGRGMGGYFTSELVAGEQMDSGFGYGGFVVQYGIIYQPRFILFGDVLIGGGGFGFMPAGTISADSGDETFEDVGEGVGFLCMSAKLHAAWRVTDWFSLGAYYEVMTGYKVGGDERFMQNKSVYGSTWGVQVSFGAF